MTDWVFLCYNTSMNNFISKILISLGTLSIMFIGVNYASAANCNSSWTTPIGCNDSSYYQYNSGYSYNQPYNNYDYNYYTEPYQQYAYTQPVQYSHPIPNNPGAPIINNYYQTTNNPAAPSTSTKSTSNTVAKSTTSSSTKSVVKEAEASNNEAFTSTNSGQSFNNGLTALSFRGSGSFLPSSFWQWLLVIVLILFIVILIRLINKYNLRNRNHSTPIH